MRNPQAALRILAAHAAPDLAWSIDCNLFDVVVKQVFIDRPQAFRDALKLGPNRADLLLDAVFDRQGYLP